MHRTPADRRAEPAKHRHRASRNPNILSLRTSVRYVTAVPHFPAGRAARPAPASPAAARPRPAVARRPRHAARRRSRSSSSTSRRPAHRRAPKRSPRSARCELRGGELLGTFETLVNPGVPIPPMITVLTGITEAMVLPAPRIAEVLPAFLEFARDAVIVGHNIRFDCAFLDAALVAHGYPRLRQSPRRHRRARRAGSSATRSRTSGCTRSRATSARPSSRCTARTPTRPRPPRCCTRCSSGPRRSACSASTTCSRSRRCARTRRRRSSRSRPKLPRAPGRLSLSRSRTAGCSTWARRRTSAPACAPTSRPRTAARFPSSCARPTRIEHRVCGGPFEAAVRELRLIQRLEPRFNRQSKSWRRYTYLKLTDERFPRLMVTR